MKPKSRKGYKMCPKCHKRMQRLSKELHFCIACRIGADLAEPEYFDGTVKWDSHRRRRK